MTVLRGDSTKLHLPLKLGRGHPSYGYVVGKKKMWQFEIEIAWQNMAGQVTGFGRMKMQQIYPVDEVK